MVAVIARAAVVLMADAAVPSGMIAFRPASHGLVPSEMAMAVTVSLAPSTERAIVPASAPSDVHVVTTSTMPSRMTALSGTVAASGMALIAPPLTAKSYVAVARRTRDRPSAKAALSSRLLV